MNAVMRIQVIAYGRQAQQQLRGVNTEVKLLQAQMMRANASGAAFGRMFRTGYMEKWGKNLQWTGRQIEYNFTLPLAIAAGMATKFALENEKAMTRLIKVYGDGSEEMERVAKQDVPLLRRGFEALSSIFGVQQKEVIEVGAAWAQAGRQGVALARATRLTLQTAILGNFELAEAQEALIVIQDQYRLNTKELTEAVATLNMIENRTAVDLEGLVRSIQRAGGIAVSAGISIRELGAMTAALTPATGTATQAGNALRTMISRLMAPTTSAYNLFRELGVQVDQAAWHNANFMERIKMLGAEMDNLTDSQRNVVATEVFSRWQVARADVLIRALADETGRYADAINATADANRNAIQMQQEINAVLQSSPQRFQILIVQLQNLLARVIQPLIPAMMAFVSQLVKLMRKFEALPIETQTTILAMLTLLAVFGPLLRIIGATTLLLARLFGAFKVLLIPLRMLGTGLLGVAKVAAALGTAFSWVFGFIAAGGKALLTGLAVGFRGLPALLLGPFGLVLAGLVTFFALFHGHIRDGLIWVRDNWNRLPEIIANALRNVMDVLRAAGEGIRRMLTSMFSFGTPTVGVQTSGAPPTATPGTAMQTGGVIPGYGSGDKVPALLEPGEFVMRRAAVDKYGLDRMEDMNRLKYRYGGLVQRFQAGGRVLENFNVATAPARRQIEAARRAEQRADVVAVAPNAGPAFDAMVRTINRLQGDLDRLGASMRAQQAVVDVWAAKLRTANRELETQQKRLNELIAVANRYREALDSANATIAQLSQTPITGMRKMSDAIFENEMAQKRLRLEMLKMEEAGESIEDIRTRMSRLAGDLERLRANREDLRLAGAGSDVLGNIDAEINAMQRAYDQMGAGGGTTRTDEMIDEMERLRREGERLQLEESLEFDPLRRQIEQLTDTMGEMPFAQIIAGIKEQQREVARLTPLWEQADAAVREQQGVVDALTLRRDAIQEAHDAEREMLDEISGQYNETASRIRDMESALDDFASKAKSVREAAERAAKEEALPPSIERFRDAAIGTEGWEDVTGSFAPIETDIGLEELVRQWEEEANQLFGDLDLFKPLRDRIEKTWADFKEWFSGLAGSLGLDVGTWAGLFAGAQEAWENSWLGNLWGHISPALKRVWDQLVGFFKNLIDAIIDELGLWEGGFDQMGREFEGFLGFLLIVWENVWNAISLVLQPILDGIVEAVRSFIQIIRGIWDIVAGLFSGDWERVWSGIATLVDGIADFFINLADTIIGIVEGIALGILQGFINLITPVGEALERFSHAVLDTFIEGWNRFDDWLQGHFDNFVEEWDAFWSGLADTIVEVWNSVNDWIQGYFDDFVAEWDAFWSSLYTGLVGVLTSIWNFITDIFTRIYNWLIGRSLIPDLINGIIGWFTRMRDWLRGIWDSVWLKISGIWVTIKTAVNAAAQYVRDRITYWFGLARDGARVIWDAVWTKISEIWTTIKTAVNTAAQYVRDRINHWFGSAREIVRSVFDGISEKIREVMDKAKTKVETVATAMETAFKNARDGIGAAVEGIKNKLKTPINWVINTAYNNGIRKFWNAIASKIGAGQLGEIKPIELNRGGQVPGTGRRDTVPAMLTPGEWVVTKDAASNLGEERLKAIEQWGRNNDSSFLKGMMVEGADHTGPGYSQSGFGGVKAHVAQAGHYLNRMFGPFSGGIGGVGQRANASDHPKGLALDFMTMKNVDQGNRLVEHLIANAKHFLLKYVIWRQRINVGGGWRKMENRGNATANHMDHPHVSFLSGGGASRNFAGSGEFGVDEGILSAFRDAWSFVKGIGQSDDQLMQMAFSSASKLGKEAIGYGIGKIPFGDQIRRIIGFYNGGTIRGSRDGTVVRVGEGYQDERIIPLRRDWSNDGDGGGGTTNHFHGNLVFPNVENGDDAEAFIRNLESMVSG